MTDSELLELAAKAAGEPYTERAPEGGLYLSNGQDWNPLTDDGDALRLAVKCRVQLQTFDNSCTCAEVCFKTGDKYETFFISYEHHDDPYAATRRAIVRAAAEIEKGMK